MQKHPSLIHMLYLFSFFFNEPVILNPRPIKILLPCLIGTTDKTPTDIEVESHFKGTVVYFN